MDVLILDCGSIAGASTVKDYAGKIDLLSFSFGLAQPSAVNTPGRATGKATFQDLTVTKYVDLASVGLIDHCTKGMDLPTVKLTIGQDESGTVNPYLIFTLTNAIVSSVSMGGGGGGKPQETVTFNYTAIAWDYKLQSASGGSAGAQSAKWNLLTNTAS